MSTSKCFFYFYLSDVTHLVPPPLWTTTLWLNFTALLQKMNCDSHLFFQLKWIFPTSNAASFLISFLKTHSYRPNLWSMSWPLYYFYSHFAIFCLFSHYCTDFSTLPSFYLLSCLTGRPICSPTLSIKQFHKYCFKNCCINNMVT